MTPAQPVYLVKGDDPALLGQTVSQLVQEVLAGASGDLAVEDLPEEATISAVLDAAQTPSFLTERRVVIVRAIGRFRADEVQPLVDYLTAPLPTTSLVLVAGGGVIAARLTKAVKEHGKVIDASAPSGKARQAWLAEQLKRSPVHLDRRAADLLGAHLGDELGQIAGLLDALASAYGEGATISVAELEPFLGAGGSAAPWELTDAIDSGNTEMALAQLRRMLGPGQRHPLVVMATLHRHFGALLRLDGSNATSEGEAAALVGMAPYPAKKALAQSRRLGSASVLRAVRLLAEADVDLRGGSAWPNELVLEVLVARLSKLPSQGRSAQARPRSA